MNSVNKSTKDSETNWERLEAMQDNDIDLSNIPEITEDQFKNAKLRFAGKSIFIQAATDSVACRVR